jgi:GH15 family glucan-1,4-alpha-glucosidase
MDPSGLWNTRQGQYDAQGQNLWASVEHYKLSGDRHWLDKTAYPYIKRATLWIVNSHHRHREEIKNPDDPRYGLIQPGDMEAWVMVKGTHFYYMDVWAVLGLGEAVDAADALGLAADHELFAREARELKASLYKSSQQTSKRSGLYEGHLRTKPWTSFAPLPIPSA